MSKRIQMIPLLVLIVCSGISMSSGLYYYDINEASYVIHVFIIGAVYYLTRYLFREMKQRELIGLAVSLVGIFIFFIFLYPVTEPGIYDILNTISTKIHLSYGIDLGKWNHPDSAPVGLVIGQLLALVTSLSLYFYETKRPVVITALPSFLLFIISVIADGVPYEMCFIVYGATLIIFLGMGRYGGNIKKLALLTSCTVIAGLLFVMVFSWNDVDLFMRGYRSKFVVSKKQTTPKKETDTTPEREKQTINFGQFSWDGDITYTGTVELYLYANGAYDHEALFLRGFVGNYFSDNTWYGEYTLNENDTNGNAFAKEKNIRIENAFDRGIYVPYSTNQAYYERVMKMTYEEGKKNLEKISPETKEVDVGLEKRIREEILGGEEFFTGERPFSYGEVVEFVKDYFEDRYKYTLHPGEVLYEENEIEKFLFERKKGYCTHFASAATMIFRTAGIPARLAQGYMVSGMRISPEEITSVYDSNAHAWVEIYVTGEGWIPIDVTPRLTRVAEGENATNGGEEAGEVIPEEPAEVMITESPEEGQEEEVEEETEEEEEEEKKEKKQKKKTAGKKEGNILSGREETDGAGGGSGTDEVFMVLRYVIYFLGFDLILLLCLAGYRLRQYVRMKRKLTEGSFSERLLHMNDNLKRFWHILGVDWDYSDSAGLTEVIYKATSKYYIFGDGDAMSEFRQRIHSYVISVYKARYDGKSISREEYHDCQSYFLELLKQIQKQKEGKIWKKVRKCNMVKIIYKKEKRESNG